MGFLGFFKKNKKKEQDYNIEHLTYTANRLADIINESLDICAKSTNLETKKSRIKLAEEKLNELKTLGYIHKNVSIGFLDETESVLAKYKKEIELKLDSEFHPLVIGMEFHPTLHIKTPLWILEKNGEFFNGDIEDRPQYGDQSQGVWVPKVDNKYDFLDKDSTVSSDAGPVDAEQYLRYVKSFRQIIESDIFYGNKIKAINELPNLSVDHDLIHYKLIKTYGGIDKLYDCVFSNNNEKIDYFYDKHNYLHLINGLNKVSIDALSSQGINTINQLSKMKDEDLLSIKGIGKVSLKKIRTIIKCN